VRLQIDVLVWRGAIPESRHRVQAVLCDAAGRIESATDEPDLRTTFRSAAKPFQLLPLVERGHADRWRFSPEELAIMSASHTGSEYHVRLVTGILARLGLADRHLACGFHEPFDPISLAHVRSHPEERSPLYNNCSGKHAGMLCLALSEGWPVEGYQKPEHPVQQLMRFTVADLSGMSPESLGVAIDGCSVPVFGLPLRAMGRAYAQLAAARDEGTPRERALARIREAMCAFPRAIGGEGRLSTMLMGQAGGRLVAKGGAEGLECIGLVERGLGLVLKSEDGQARGLGPAALATLEQLGELSPADLERMPEWHRPVVKNHAGLEVGSLEASIKVLAPVA
jgi:L-asparaginase II